MGRHSMEEQVDVGDQAEQDDVVDPEQPTTPGLHRATGPFDLKGSKDSARPARKKS